jgi:hypothetical protein
MSGLLRYKSDLISPEDSKYESVSVSVSGSGVGSVSDSD